MGSSDTWLVEHGRLGELDSNPSIEVLSDVYNEFMIFLLFSF